MPQPTASGVTGLILAGGRGSRMGYVDKGLQPFRGKPMVTHVIERLSPQVDTVIINANQNAATYAQFGFPVIADEIEGFAGPLAGFERGLAHCATEWMITAPCDSPFLPLDLVARLMRAADKAGASIAYPTTGAQTQPIFCLLRATLLPSLREFLASGQRKIDKWTASLPMIEVPFDEAQAFANINTLEELNEFSKLP